VFFSRKYFLRKQGKLAGALYRFRQPSLMAGADTGLFFGLDFSHARHESVQKVGFFEIDLF